MITPAEIQAKAETMRARGVDLRTIRLHFEAVQGRALEPAEDEALLAAHRAAEPLRHEREKAAELEAANEVRRQRPR